MTLLKFCMLAVVGIAAAMVIKQWKNDFLPLLRLALALIFAFAAIQEAGPILTFLRELSATPALASYASPLLKSLGIAVLASTCASICRECGEPTLAEGVELVGKTEILLLSLPLMREILSAAASFLALGE